jgi:hypothetical protein
LTGKIPLPLDFSTNEEDGKFSHRSQEQMENYNTGIAYMRSNPLRLKQLNSFYEHKPGSYKID